MDSKFIIVALIISSKIGVLIKNNNDVGMEKVFNQFFLWQREQTIVFPTDWDLFRLIGFAYYRSVPISEKIKLKTDISISKNNIAAISANFSISVEY